MDEPECNCCLETDKILIQCSGCKATTCRSCIDRWSQEKGYQCNLCKLPIPRLKIFFAGKITEKPDGYESVYGDVRYMPPCALNKIPVVDKSASSSYDRMWSSDSHWVGVNGFYNMLHESKNAGWKDCPPTLFDPTNYVSLETYMNMEERVPWIKFEKYILTGPCCILDPCIFSVQHSCWFDNPYVNPIDFVETLNKRNDEMINDCEVFSLYINAGFDCFRSITEWGMAKANDKILLIYFESVADMRKEFYTHIQDSISSLDKLDDNKKELVIYCHPELSKRFTSFQNYKQYLETIMKLKKKK